MRKEVNDRVMTVLFSSAQVSFRVWSQSFSSELAGLQVAPRLSTDPFALSSSAARRTSVVSPDRESRTAWFAPLRRRISLESKSNSEAGNAEQGTRRTLDHSEASSWQR